MSISDRTDEADELDDPDRTDALETRLSQLTGEEVETVASYSLGGASVVEPEADVVLLHGTSTGRVRVEGTGDELVVALAESTGGLSVENVGAAVAVGTGTGDARVSDADAGVVVQTSTGRAVLDECAEGLAVSDGTNDAVLADVDVGAGAAPGTGRATGSVDDRASFDAILDDTELRDVVRVIDQVETDVSVERLLDRTRGRRLAEPRRRRSRPVERHADPRERELRPDRSRRGATRGASGPPIEERQVAADATRTGLVPGEDTTGLSGVVSHPDVDVLVRIPGRDADPEAFAERLEHEGLDLAEFDVVFSLNQDDHEALVSALADDVDPEEGPEMLYPARAGALDEMAEILSRDAEHADEAFIVHGEDDTRAHTIADGLSVQSLAFAPGDETGSRHIGAVVDEHRDAAFVFAGANALDEDEDEVAVDQRIEVAGLTFETLNEDRLGDDAEVVLQASADVDPERLGELVEAVGATQVWFDGDPEATEAAEEEPTAERGRLERVLDRLPGPLGADPEPDGPAVLDALDDDVEVRVRGEDEAPALDATPEGTDRVSITDAEGQFVRMAEGTLGLAEETAERRWAAVLDGERESGESPDEEAEAVDEEAETEGESTPASPPWRSVDTDETTESESETDREVEFN